MNEKLKQQTKEFCKETKTEKLSRSHGKLVYTEGLLIEFAQSLIDSGRFVEAHNDLSSIELEIKYIVENHAAIYNPILSIFAKYIISKHHPITNVPVISDEEMLRSAHEYTYSISGMDQFTISEQLVHAHYAGAKWYRDQLKEKP